MIDPSHLHQTRTSYDAVAADYARLVHGWEPWEPALLTVFAELVRAAGGGPVADVGCGPGRVTARLHSLGLDAFGIDLSPGMIEVARRDHPGLPFDVGSMTALDLADGGLGGGLAWWSIIHTPHDLLPVVFAEFHRVLAPDGHLLVGFHVGDERRHKNQGYGGHSLSLDIYLQPPERLIDLANDAGLDLLAQLLLKPDDTEGVPQACLLFRKPATTRPPGHQPQP